MDYSWIEKERNMVVVKKGWIFVGIMEERDWPLYEKVILKKKKKKKKRLLTSDHNSGRPFYVRLGPFWLITISHNICFV